MRCHMKRDFNDFLISLEPISKPECSNRPAHFTNGRVQIRPGLEFAGC